MHFLVAHGYETPTFQMAAPCIAFLPTSECHNFRLCANVSSLIMRQKPTRSTVSNRHHTLALRMYWSGHRFHRFYITNLMPIFS